MIDMSHRTKVTKTIGGKETFLGKSLDNKRFKLIWICRRCGSKTSSELTRREYHLRFRERNTEHNITCGLCGNPKMIVQDIPEFLIDGTG